MNTSFAKKIARNFCTILMIHFAEIIRFIIHASISYVFLQIIHSQRCNSVLTEQWILPKNRRKFRKYTKTLNAVILMILIFALTVPISHTVFFALTPDVPINPKQLIPDRYSWLKDNFVVIVASVVFETWIACVGWYAMLMLGIMGTTYIGTKRNYNSYAISARVHTYSKIR